MSADMCRRVVKMLNGEQNGNPSITETMCPHADSDVDAGSWISDSYFGYFGTSACQTKDINKAFVKGPIVMKTAVVELDRTLRVSVGCTCSAVTVSCKRSALVLESPRDY